jgi:hydroxymethylglutaryl-CoA lyase
MMTSIIIHEVGPRDGLQVEKQVVPTEKKIEWIRKLMNSGIDIVQVGSFVHPEKVPQMADTDEIFRMLTSEKSNGRAILSGLVLNEKGLDRALKCGVEMICMGVSASETHSQKNTGMSSAEAQERIIATANAAAAAGKKIQVSVQSAFGCGFEGCVPEARVMGIVGAYLEAGLRNISLADTAGHAHPSQVKRLFHRIFQLAPDAQCTCHFHDTYGLGMANIYAALDAGVTSFETSFSGLGGCPFTKVAAGNVATEDLVHGLQRQKIRRDIELSVLLEVARDIAAFFGREMQGRVYKTGPINYTEENHEQ